MTGQRPWHRRLLVRLLASHLLVVLIGAASTGLLVRLMTPGLFDRRYGRGPGPGRAELHDALESALQTAVVVGALVGFAVAGLASVTLSRRIIGPITRIGRATRTLAGGRLTARVEPGGPVELAELATDVNTLAEVLTASERRRQALVTDLSHELRTPIGIVGGYLEALQDGLVEPTPELFAELGAEVGRLERLAADLGLLSRLDEGRLELVRVRFDLGELAVATAERMRPQFERAGISLTVRHPPHHAPVVADRDRITQVLANLLANSLRYTPGGGDVQIGVTGPAADGQVRCEIRDTGRGITAEEMAVIFDRFHRGTASSGAAGAGVGLTIARELARAHGGEVEAASPGAGLGATFVLRLASARAEA